MTTSYRRRALPLLAFLYTGQPLADTPDWLRNYKRYTNVGESPVYETLGIIQIPIHNGNSIKLPANSWAVLEGDVISVYTKDQFDELFEESDQPGQPQNADLAPVPQGGGVG